jgi:hypothetical protein
VLDFSQVPRSAPQYPAPPIVVGAACPTPVVVVDPFSVRSSVGDVTSMTRGRALDSATATLALGKQESWRELREFTARFGWGS